MTTPRTKINKSDLKIFPSERLTDNADGGGMPLGTPLTGEPNELFNPISSIARVNGAFNARLTYQGLQRADDEPLIGAYSAITRPPTDPNVSYLLFPATRFGESRAEILKRIEAYKIGTIASRMTLLSKQAQNSKIVQAYQYEHEPLPIVGDTFCLTQDMDGYPKVEQYIQVVSVESEGRIFVDRESNELFRKMVVKMEISSPLIADFIGVEYPTKNHQSPPCKIRETHVADAGQYFGVKPLAKAISIASRKIKVTELSEQIIPTNQIETPLPDMPINNSQLLFNSGNPNEKVKRTINKDFNKGDKLFLSTAIEIGSLVIDSHQGKLTELDGMIKKSNEIIANINYSEGYLEFAVNTYVNYIKYRPAVSDRQAVNSTSIEISENNQRTSYSITLEPSPAESSLKVSYLSQGQWYELHVSDSGQLRGASKTHGGGNINYATGTVTITCGALPDIGSRIVFEWATASRYQNKTAELTTAYLPIKLGYDTDPTSINISWQMGNSAKTATLSHGKLTGDAKGFFDSENNVINIDIANSKINQNSVFTVSYKQANADEIFNQNISVQFGSTNTSLKDDKVTINFEKEIERGFIIETQLKIYENEPIENLNWQRLVDDKLMIYDDKNGNLTDDKGEVIGTVDYVTGKLVFAVTESRTIQYSSYQIKDGKAIFNGIQTKQAEVIVKEIKRIYYYQSTINIETVKQAVSTSKLVLSLPNDNINIAKNSVVFHYQNNYYMDRDGQIYHEYNLANNSIKACGTIDYVTGQVIINDWQYVNNQPVVINSLATYIASNPIDSIDFRIPAMPLAVGSLQIKATTVKGDTIFANAKNDGSITGRASGFVDCQYAFAQVKFDEMVIAESISYNAVAQSYLPIDSSIIKIDTVRLPSDGRVPIFRQGDTILIGNRQSEKIGSAFNGGETVQLSRTNLDRICLKDSKGKPVLADLWDYDLEAGTITFATPADLGGYQMPLIAHHAHEERNRILKCDIDGTLELMFATKHDYPLENTYVSSVLISGDLQVRVYSLFTQRSWNNVWQDTPIGEQLLNKLNLTDYPMLLTDDGAITERWLIKFKSSNQFELYGERVGFVGRFDTLADVAPLNPATNKPYFTIKNEAFGNTDATWASQDVIRFNTEGTLVPIWVLCAVQPSSNVPTGDDGFTQCLYGDTTEI